MKGEIQQVVQFLSDYSAMIRDQYKKRSVQLAGRSSASINTSLNIKVSLILYQDIQPSGTFNTRILFKKLTIPGQLPKIQRAFKQIPAMLGGSREALHDGLLTALNQSDLWSGEYSHRMIILIADEPGDSGGATQGKVLGAMPLPRQKLQALRFDPAKVNKTDFTRLWAIYTGNTSFDKFNRNVRQLTTPDRIIHIRDFNSNRAQRETVQKKLYASLDDAGQVTDEKVKMLSELTRHGKSQAATKLSSPTMLVRVAIDAALKRTGMTIEELSKLSDVAFVVGFTKEQYSYHSQPTFRRRIVIEENELITLKETVKAFTLNLRQALNSIVPQRRDPQELVGQAMMYAIAAIEGDYDTMEILDDPLKRGRAINQWWKTGETSNQTIADLIKAPQFLPLSKTGIFGVTRQALRNWSFDRLRKETNTLLQKIGCMDLVINDKTVPNRVGTCLSHKGKTKRWRYQPPNSATKYIYLPDWMIP
jgi:hypothetical protein